MGFVKTAWMITSTLFACMHLTSVAANDIQEELKVIDEKIIKEEKKIKAQQVKQKKAKRELSKTKKEIDLLEKDLNKLSKKEKKLLKELRSLEKREKALSKVRLGILYNTHMFEGKTLTLLRRKNKGQMQFMFKLYR